MKAFSQMEPSDEEVFRLRRKKVGQQGLKAWCGRICHVSGIAKKAAIRQVKPSRQRQLHGLLGEFDGRIKSINQKPMKNRVAKTRKIGTFSRIKESCSIIFARFPAMSQYANAAAPGNDS